MRRLTHILAIVLACSTGLAGVPLITALGIPDPQAGAVISPQQFDPEKVSECRGEEIEEEREEEKAADAELVWCAGPSASVVVDFHRTGRTTIDFLQAAAGSRDAARSIRGPPAG